MRVTKVFLMTITDRAPAALRFAHVRLLPLTVK